MKKELPEYWQLLSPPKKADVLTEYYGKAPKRSRYYRFRISEKEKQILEKNRELLKDYDLTLSDAVRYFSLNCINYDALYNLGLITNHMKKEDNKKVVKYRCRAK